MDGLIIFEQLAYNVPILKVQNAIPFMDHNAYLFYLY